MQNLRGPPFKQLRSSKSGNPSKLPNFSPTIMFEERAAISIFHNRSPKSFDRLSSSSLAHVPQLDVLTSFALAADAREHPPSLFPFIPMQSRSSACAVCAWRPLLTCWKERGVSPPVSHPLYHPACWEDVRQWRCLSPVFFNSLTLSLFSGMFTKVNHSLALENQR